MTTEEWLAATSPQPPAALASAVLAAIRAAPSGGSELPQHFLAAGAKLLPEVIENGCEFRSGALGLLTLDSLLTYAMQTASSSPTDCERIASDALSVLGQAAESLRDEPSL